MSVRIVEWKTKGGKVVQMIEIDAVSQAGKSYPLRISPAKFKIIRDNMGAIVTLVDAITTK